MTVNPVSTSMERIQPLSTIFKEKYTIINEIARGTHSTVFLCKNPLGKLFAVKQYIVRDPELVQEELGFNNKEFFKNLAQWELEISNSMQHPNILTVREIFFEGAIPYVVMDYIDGNTINSCDRKSLNKSAVTYQFLDVVEYLLLRSFMIENISLEKILISKDNNLMLIDIGGLGYIEINDNISINTYLCEIEHILYSICRDIPENILRSCRSFIPSSLNNELISIAHIGILTDWIQSLKKEMCQFFFVF